MAKFKMKLVSLNNGVAHFEATASEDHGSDIAKSGSREYGQLDIKIRNEETLSKLKKDSVYDFSFEESEEKSEEKQEQ